MAVEPVFVGRGRARWQLAMTVAGAAALTALLLAAAPNQEGPPPGPPASFGENRIWDDGKAELCRYAAEEFVEGERRSFTAWSVIVAEHFDTSEMVKLEGYEPGCTPVLKCNWFLQIPTGVSSYQQMASLFLRRSDQLVMKASFSSQDWCGMTFAAWRRDREGLETRSYWSGEADRTHELPEFRSTTLFYEQLPLWIRGRRPDRARTEPITLIGKRLGTSHCPPPKVVAAAIWFDGAVKGADGPPLLQARLLVDKHQDTFLFASEFPHVMQEWQRTDGTTWKLEKSVRLDYWKFGKNEFAKLLEQ